MSERFVDVDEKPIPPVDTWHDLSLNQLVDVRNELSDKVWTMRAHPQIVKVLNDRLKLLDSMVTARLSQ